MVTNSNMLQELDGQVIIQHIPLVTADTALIKWCAKHYFYRNKSRFSSRNNYLSCTLDIWWI